MYKNITKPTHFRKLMIIFVASITVLLISAMFRGDSSLPSRLKIDGWQRKYLNRCCVGPNQFSNVCDASLKYKKVHTIVGFIGSGDCEDADEVFYAPTDVMLFGLAGAMVSGGLLASPTVRTYTYLFYKKRS